MDIREILKKYKIIAVVGCSKNPAKDAHQIPKYMQGQGYRIIPINPGVDEILGEKAYKSLLDLPEELKRAIEIVNIFRPSDAVPPIVDQAIRLKGGFGRPYVIWMQLGIENGEAAKKAKDAGMEVVMNRCIMVAHRWAK